MRTPLYALLLILPAMANAAETEAECKIAFENVVDTKKQDIPKGAGLPDNTTIKQYHFTEHCKAGSRLPDCDDALASVRFYYETSAEKLKAADAFCKKTTAEITQCKVDQAKSQKCMAESYKKLSTTFTNAAGELTNAANRLAEKSISQKAVAQKLRESAVAARISTNSGLTAKFLDGASSGATDTRGPTQTTACASSIKNWPDAKKFCSHITAATDSAYYASKLREKSTRLAALGDKYSRLAGTSGERADNSGRNDGKGGPSGPGGPEKKGGLLDSLGGLNGLMTMGTLGMMGAGLYCSVSGKCTKKPDEAEDQMTAPEGITATSPTPASAALGNASAAEKAPGAGSSSTDSKTETNTFAAQDYSTSGTGFSNVTDSALDPFSGALDRAPSSGSSSSSPGGGGGGGAEASSGSSGAKEAEAPKLNFPESSFSSSGGGGGGGGGFAAPGSFSLGDSGSSSPADSALKDILNGDMPAGDSGMGASLDGMDPAAAQGETGVDLQGAESLFFRVKDTHTRCMKRGWIVQVEKGPV